MKIKKLLALVLALAMVLSCVTAFAAMENTADTDYYEVVTSTKDHKGTAQNLLLKTDDSDQPVVDSAYNTTGAYIQDANGVHWEMYTSKPVGGGYNPFGYSEINSSFTGKYVLTNKQMYHHYDGNASRKVNHGMYLAYNSSDVGIYYFGFVLDFADASSNVDVSFVYNAENPRNQKNYSLGSFTDVYNGWVTYQQIWDLDAKTATLNVYKASGELIATFEHKLLDTVNNVTVPYKDFYTSNFWTSSTAARGYFKVDDYEIVKVSNVPVTADFNSDLVSVKYNGNAVTSGVATPTVYNSDAVFSIEPIGDNVISGITVDGKAIESTTQVTFDDIREAHSFSVTVKGDEYSKKLYKTDNSEHKDSIVATDYTHAQLTQLSVGTTPISKKGSGYVKVGNEYYWAQCSNAAPLSTWFNPMMYTASDSFAGEYTVVSEVLYQNYQASSLGKISLYAVYDKAVTDTSFMGYDIAWDNSGISTVSFKTRYGSNETSEALGTYAFTNGGWYTYRQVYNLDNKTADLYILNSAGTEVAHFSYKLLSAVNGTTIPYKDFSAVKMYSESKNRGLVYVGDSAVYKTIAKPVTVKYDAEKGAVKCDDAVVANGEKIPVAYNSADAKTFAIEAKEGYEIADVKVNGESKGNLVSSYEFKNLTADQELEVIFAEKKVEAPTVEVTEYATAKNYAYKVGEADATSPYTVIMYGKIAGQPENYGFALSNGDASVKLDAKSVDANGTFAIRVVGGAILPGSYTAVPYWTDGEGEAFAITVAE